MAMRAARYALVGTALALLSAKPALAVDVTGTSVRLSWTAATGPVASYRVEVSRSGAAFALEQSVTTNLAQLTGGTGETLLVRVSAVDSAGDVGPTSPLSDAITFVAATTTTTTTTTSSTSTSTTSTTTTTSSPTPAPTPGPNLAADLDGDGRPDALAVDGAGTLTGIVRTSDGARWIAIGRPLDTGMRPVGFADADGDGHADVLWRNAKSGANELWLMHGLTYSVIALPTQDARFRVAAFRDFTGDGAADVLWHDPQTLENRLWRVGVGGLRETLSLDAGASGTRLVAVADVNGDGAPDLVWQDGNSRALEAWLLRGTIAQAVSALGFAPSGAAVAGVGDLDANGVDDLVWRRNVSGGTAIDVWFLDASGGVRSGTATTLSNGSLRGVADLDGDGKDDLALGVRTQLGALAVLPQNKSGSTTLWQTRAIYLGNVPPATWRVLSLH